MKLQLNNSYLTSRSTPWDEKVLGVPTNEIIELVGADLSELKSLLQQFEDYCISNQVKYTNLRISAQEKWLKKILQQEGFQFVESSIEVIRSSSNFIIDARLTKQIEKIEVINFNPIHLLQIKQIAATAFNYGRFAEDVNLDSSYHQIRNSNWVDDLINQNTFKTLLYKNIPIGFMSYKINNSICELILGGVQNEYQHLAPAFWSIILDSISKDVKSFKTIISAANIGVFNLYIKLGFSVNTTYWGFSKLRNIQSL